MVHNGHVKRETVEVDGVTLAYTVEGAGRPLLVVGSSIYYPRTFSAGLRQSCTLVCADLPHFVKLGPAFPLEALDFDFYSRCIEPVRVHAGLGQVVVVGHSHHGNVALEYAKRYPHCVSHVVLIGSPPVNVAQTIAGAEHYWACHASEQRKAILGERRCSMDEQRLDSLSPEEAYIARYIADAPLYWNDPTYDAAWLWEGMSFDMAAVRAFRELYSAYQLNWESQAFDGPGLVVMGRNDYAVPHLLWEPVLPRLENVSFRLLEHSGHTPQLEQPQEFDSMLLSWLGRAG